MDEVLSDKELLSKFLNIYTIIIIDILKEFHTYKQNKKNKTPFRTQCKKYPFLNRAKWKKKKWNKALNNNRKPFLPYFWEIIKLDAIKAEFTKEQLDNITRILIKKIRGLYKHMQTDKTKLINNLIKEALLDNKILICITKNSLISQIQWASRLIEKLSNETNKSPKSTILVVSSKKNDFGGMATHCKTMVEATAKVMNGNFKIIFLCSNSVRIEDVIFFLDSYGNFKEDIRVPINIHHDEAHNETMGVPVFRAYFEHMLLYPYVEGYIPISATPTPLWEGKGADENPLWIEKNLMDNGINYTAESNLKSDHPDYVSLQKIQRKTFQEIRNDLSYTQYPDTHIGTVRDFIYSDDKYKNVQFKNVQFLTEEQKEDIEKRRKLAFGPYPGIGDERETFNMGKNILDNPIIEDLFTTNATAPVSLFIPNKFNLHLMITPLRVIFTVSMIRWAQRQSYTPICIGVYRSDIHIWFKNVGKQCCLRFSKQRHLEKFKDCAFNEKLYQIMKLLYKNKINIKVPWIIMGCEQAGLSESVTIVNYKYKEYTGEEGALRSVILLATHLTPSQNGQAYGRVTYTKNLFVRHNQNFAPPRAYIIGSSKSITDALRCEELNDTIVDNLIEQGDNDVLNNRVILPNNTAENRSTDDLDGQIAIPISLRIKWFGDMSMIKLQRLLCKRQTNNIEKTEILNLIKKGISAGVIEELRPPDYKFDLSRFNLVIVRIWTKKRKDPSGYRFSKFSEHHRQEVPFKGAGKKGEGVSKDECEILYCKEPYNYKDHRQWPGEFFIGYRY